MTATALNNMSRETEMNGDDSQFEKDEGEQTGTLIEEETIAEQDISKVEQDISPSEIAGKETKNTIVLAISFLCVFTSYRAIQNLQGSLNDEGGLGVISLSCLYGANVISSIMAPLILTIFPFKRVFLAAFTAHLIYNVCNFYPSFPTLIPASILLGAATGTLWTSQGIYLTKCAFSIATETGMPVYATLSRINGIFFSIFDLSGITGNLVSSLLLHQGHYNTSNINSSEVCGVNDCPGAQNVDIIADPELWIVYILLGVFLGCVLTGVVTTVIFLSPIKTDDWCEKISPTELFLTMFKMTAKTDMKYVIPLTLYTAISSVICFSEMTKAYISCPIGIQNVGYVLMAHGVCESISGFVSSRLAKFTTCYVLLTLFGIIHMTLLIWIYNWIPTHQDTILIYVLISFWGIGNGVLKIQYNSVLGKHFASDIRSAFATAQFLRSVGFTLALVYSSLLCMRVKLFIAIVFLSVSMALYYIVEIKYYIRRSKRRKLDKELPEI